MVKTLKGATDEKIRGDNFGYITLDFVSSLLRAKGDDLLPTAFADLDRR
jgi:hypothetical protein